MAGIGFEIRKLLAKGTLSGGVSAYAYAGIVSSGPWVLSIISILAVGILVLGDVLPHIQISQFQVSITYLISFSLVVSGIFQHLFTRYIADQFYLKKTRKIISNLHGAMTIMTAISGVFALLAAHFFLKNTNNLYKLQMVSGFVILCNIWLLLNLMSGLKSYKSIFYLFLAAYGIVVIVDYFLRHYGLNGLIFGFIFGNFVLLTGMLTLLYKDYGFKQLISFHFLKKKNIRYTLILTGVLFNLGIWADKFVFWFSPSTSMKIIGSLRASPIYDLPIFLAYLSIIPGMAVFLLRMETEFVEFYHYFYNTAIMGGTLEQINHAKKNMIFSAKKGIMSIIKIQGLAVLFFLLGEQALLLLNISPLYYNLLCIDLVSAGLQVVLLGLFNIGFYLDKRKLMAKISLLFASSNILFSYLSIKLGIYFFGYGFSLSLLITVMVAMFCLDRDFNELEYQTFMLQPTL